MHMGKDFDVGFTEVLRLRRVPELNVQFAEYEISVGAGGGNAFVILLNFRQHRLRVWEFRLAGAGLLLLAAQLDAEFVAEKTAGMNEVVGVIRIGFEVDTIRVRIDDSRFVDALSVFLAHLDQALYMRRMKIFARDNRELLLAALGHKVSPSC